MKRIFVSLFLILLCVTVLCSVLVGCNPETEEQDGLLLMDFENYDELMRLKFINAFGKFEFSDEVVTSGKSGAYVKVQGNMKTGRKPTIGIEVDKEPISRTNWEDIDYFTLDVYNPMDRSGNIYVQFISADGSKITYGAEMGVTVEAGYRGQVKIEVDRGVLSKFIRLDYCTQVNLIFDRMPEYGGARDEFYIDSLRAHFTTESYNKNVKVRQDHEIESADEDLYLAAWSARMTLSMNRDPNYIKQGTGSFKLVATENKRLALSNLIQSPRITMDKSELLDISDYYSISFWMYNDNNVERTWYLLSFGKSASTKSFRLAPKSWTYVEIEVEELVARGYPVDNFVDIALSYNFLSWETETWYLDDFKANPYGYTPLIGGVQDVTVAEGEVSIPVPSVKYADGYIAKVYDKNGVEVSVVNGKFNADLGDYKVVYRATATRANASGEYASVTKEITIHVGEKPEFTYMPQSGYFGVEGELDMTGANIATSNDGEVTWKAYVLPWGNYDYGENRNPSCYNRDGYYLNGVSEDSPQKVFLGKKAVIAIDFTVTNSQGVSTTERVYKIYVDENENLPITETVSDFYTSANLGSGVSYVETDNSPSGQKMFRINNGQDSVSAVISWSKKIAGSNLSSYRFTIYNAGEYDAWVGIQGNSITRIGAKSYAIFDAQKFGYSGAIVGWGIIGATGEVKPLTINASSESAVDLYLGDFFINENALIPSFDAVSIKQSYKVGDKVEIASILCDHNFKLIDALTNEVHFSGNKDTVDRTYQITKNGYYKVIYECTLNYTSTTEQYVRTFEFDVTPVHEYQKILNTQTTGRNVVKTYSLTPIAMPEGATSMTWTVDQLFGRGLAAPTGYSKGVIGEPWAEGEFKNIDGSYKSLEGVYDFEVFAYTTYRISYYVVKDGATFRYVQYLIVDAGSAEIVEATEIDENVFEDATYKNASLVDGSEIGLPSGEKYVLFELGGGQVGSVTTNLYVGEINGDSREFVYYVYNCGDSDANVILSGNITVTIPTGAIAVMDGAPTFGKDTYPNESNNGWGVFEESELGGYVFKGVGINNVGNNAVKLALLRVSVGKNEVAEIQAIIENACTFAKTYEVGEQITVPDIGVEYFAKVYKNGVEVAVFDRETAVRTYTLADFGVYKVVYTCTAPVTGREIRVEYDFTVNPAFDYATTIYATTSHLSLSANYTLAVPTAPQGAVLTYTIDQYFACAFGNPGNFTAVGYGEKWAVGDFANGTSYKQLSNDNTFKVYAYTSYVITYCLDFSGEKYYYKQYLNVDVGSQDGVEISQVYSDIYTNTTRPGYATKNASLVDGKVLGLKSGVSYLTFNMPATGSNSDKVGSFSVNAYLGNIVNKKEYQIYLMNTGSSDATIAIPNKDVVLKAGAVIALNGPNLYGEPALTGWGFCIASANANGGYDFNQISIRNAGSEPAQITVIGIRFNSDINN